MLPTPRTLRAVCLALCVASARSGNGYAVSIEGALQAMSLTAGALDMTNAATSPMANGLTISAWIKYRDLTPTAPMAEFTIITANDANFWNGFGGKGGSYMFSNGLNWITAMSPAGTVHANWNHYAMSYDSTTGARRFYINGANVGSNTVSYANAATWTTQAPYLLIGGHCYNTGLRSGTAPVACNLEMDPDILMDDFAIFNTVLSDADITARWDQSLTARIAASLEPNLAIFYNFNTPGVAGGTVTNLGTAGTIADMTLARLRPGTGGDQMSANNQNLALTAPTFVAFDATNRADDGTTVPVVTYAAAGETISITHNSATCAFTAPSPFTAYTTTTCGGNAVHVLPKVAPTTAAQACGSGSSLINRVSTLEDRAVNMKLVTDTTWSAGVQPVISTLPTSGTLYEIPSRSSTSTATPITTAGQTVTSTGRYLRYVSNENLFGTPADTFAVSFKLAGTTVTGSTATSMPINIVEQDDLPTINSFLANFAEDTVPNGYRLTLNMTDAETGQVLDGYITALPTQGRLYAVDTASGNFTEITANYNPFDVGTGIVEQYISSVDAVSSFWGGPPYAGYHALQIIGPPDCDAKGECAGNMPWTADQSIYPVVGTRVVHQGLTAFVTNFSTVASTVTIAYHKMYKADGTNPSRQCHIDAAGASRTYPADCLFTNVPVAGQDIVATVARSAIVGVPAGVWCPLLIGYSANNPHGPGGGAFGTQYAWGPQNHDTTYLPTSGIPYTEFIEVTIDEPVYVFRVQIGMPRGMGAVTHILIKDPSGNWVRLFEGPVQLAAFNEYNSQGRYYTWSPEVCRSHFKTNKLRIQMDTQGISDWNYVDYVKVFGSRSISAASLRTGSRGIVYVPNAHASGTDSFSYGASDCPGNLIRQTGAATVRFNIAPINDLPTFTPNPTLTANVGTTSNTLALSSILSDVETPLALLTVVITSLPALGEFYDGTSLITSTPYTITNTARTIGFSVASLNGTTTAIENFRNTFTSAIGMTVTDTNGGVTQQSVTLRIVDPRIICPPGAIVEFTTAGATCTPCNSGTRAVDQSECITCEEGSSCAVGSSIQTLNVTESYWRISSDAEIFYPCMLATDTSQVWPPNCVGGPTPGAMGTGYCRSDTFGPRCAICADPTSNQTVKSNNHYFNTATLQCVECAAESGRLGSSIALILCLLVFGGLTISVLGRLWHLPPPSIRTRVLAMRAAFRPFTHLSLTAKLKQLVSFFQLATCFPSVYNVPMPPEYTSIMQSLTGWLDISTLLNLVYPTQCIGTFLTRLNFRAVGPLCLVLLPVMSTMTTGAISHCLSKDKDRPWVLKSLFSGLQTSVPLTFALVPSVSRAIFTIWECENIVVDPATSETVRFLRDDVSIICGVSAGHSAAAAVGIVYLIIWPIGMPVVYFLLCWAVRKDNKAGMPTHFARATKFLWGEYRPEYYWWEPLEMARKVVLAGLLMVVVPSSLEFLRLLVAVLIAITFTITLLIVRPFKSPDNNALAACTQIGSILMYLGALVIKIDADYSHGSVGPTVTRLVGFASVFDFTVALFFIYGTIFVIIVGFVVVQIVTTTIERAKRRHLEDIDQVVAAITSLTQTRFPCVFCRFDLFEETGKMLSHETLRAKGILTVIDTYAELLDFCKQNPTVFVSHQWLSFFVPDPENVQYKSICSAVNSLASRDSLAPSSVYIWLDYLSIPQANPFLQAMAIDSLGVYASACRYFIVAAPPAMHREKQVICDHDTYAGRGWCRLEQWARMQDGLENMYLSTSPGDLQPIADKRDWYEQSMLVFDGQFTVDTDKIKMVNIVLGLWAKTAAEIRAGKELSPISQIILDRRDEVFPKEYFFKLTDTLNEVLANPSEEIDALITLMSQRGQKAANKPSGAQLKKMIDSDGNGAMSEGEVKDAINKGHLEKGGISASTRNILAGSPAQVMPNQPKGDVVDDVVSTVVEEFMNEP